MMLQDIVVILDLGNARCTSIAREIRALGVYCEIHNHDITAGDLASLPNLKGIILNGGPLRAASDEAIEAAEAVYECGVPLLAVDYEIIIPRNQVQTLAAWPEDDAEQNELLRTFVFDTCQAQANWNMENFIADTIELLRRQIGEKKVLLALSGGVDSSVVAALLMRAVGKQLTCVFVNHGLLRKGEPEQVMEVFGGEFGVNLIYVDAVDRFLDKLVGVSDPEEKRRIIGSEFIRVFEEEARKLEGIEFLGQGTIYPDVIESGTRTAKAVKAHHNVGGLPADLQFKLVEPLKMLFKDEVRACGRALGLPEGIIGRQPFPGPGLGVRCLGAITRERLECVRESDAILREEFDRAGLSGKVWQYFTVVPEFKSVGVRNGERCFEYPVILRAVNTVDAMTASIERLDYDLLERICERITHEVPGVNRVLLDLTPKPVGTIEWE